MVSKVRLVALRDPDVVLAVLQQCGCPVESFDDSRTGPTTLVKESLGQEPTSGFLFAFVNRARNRLKILFWDGSGLILCTKRLERGTFAPMSGEGKSLSLRPEELMLLMHGIESTSRRQWHRV